MSFPLIVLALLALTSACAGIFTLVMLRRDARRETEREARTRRLTLRDLRWKRQMHRHRSERTQTTQHKQPVGTRAAHKKMIERRNLP